MPNQPDPESAIVSVWHEKVGGTFLGSAVFIAPRYVLTAKHVVDSTKYPKGFYLGLVAGQHSVPAKSIHSHDQLDMVLIELDKDMEGQHCISLYCEKSDLCSRKVDLLAVNHEHFNREQRKDKTIANWEPDSGIYKVDHRVLKGFSGGVAVLDGFAVGLMVKRHNDDQTTLIIPFSLAYDWLVSKLPHDCLPPPRPLPLHPSPQTQSAFTQRVRDEISQLLNRQKLRALRDSLSQRATPPPANPVDLLIPPQPAFDIKSSIDNLHHAVESCLQQLVDHGSSAIPDIIKDAKTVLGWLILLTVREEWLQEKGDLLGRLLDADCIAIPVETEAGTDVVVSRLHGNKARPELDADGVRVFNPNRLNWAELETGIGQRDRLMEIKKLIWKVVMKREAPLSFGAGEVEELKETLSLRYERGENYYIIIPKQRDGSSAIDNALLTQLRCEFPHLFALLIGAGVGDQVLVMPERRLVTLVREFLLMLRKFL